MTSGHTFCLQPTAQPFEPLAVDQPWPSEVRWALHARLDLLLVVCGQAVAPMTSDQYRRIDESFGPVTSALHP